jgi:hypothetical protein
MNNLKQTKPPSLERAFMTPTGNLSPIGIVKKALAKFCTPVQYDTIINDYRRSAFSDQALIYDFFKCDIPSHEVIKDDCYYKALDITTEMFKPPQCYRPVHYMQTKYYPWTLNTSVEAPFTQDPKLDSYLQEKHSQGIISSTRKTMHNCFDYVYEYFRPIVHLIKDGKQHGHQFMYWFTAHARSHLVNASDPDKIRMVFGVTKLLIIIELMLLWPMFNWLRKGLTPIAWGYETLNGGIYRIYNEIATHCYRARTFLALDWSAFDKRVRFTIIDDIHTIWFTFLDLSSGYMPNILNPSSTLDPVRITRLWKFMSKALKFTPSRLPDGSEWTRIHSTLPSGLLQTQVLDSWINAIMIITCLLALGISVTKDLFIKVLGDDSLIALKEFISPDQYESFLDKFAEEALRRFGAVLNVKKSSIGGSLESMNFLGYKFNNSIPQRDPLSLLAQLAYPERSWDVPKLAARAVGIAYASCGQSELVYNVCRDVFEFCVNVSGATPDPSGNQWLMYLQTCTSIDVTRFPSFEELSADLLSIRTNPSLDNKFYPRDFFLSDY